MPLTPAQRSTAWYFLVVAALFLVQTLLGGATAHYHAETGGFFGMDLAQWLPYNLTRTWHLQLAFFFVAAAYLAAGIFLAPLIAGREPRGQRLAVLPAAGGAGGGRGRQHGRRGGQLQGLARRTTPSPCSAPRAGNTSTWAGSGRSSSWSAWCCGASSSTGACAGKLAGESRGNLPYLFFYSALSIPLFYAVGLVNRPHTNFAIADFWRFWVVHLWVEDFLELFTTIMVAYIFVLLGVVSEKTATRVIYFDALLYSVGGVVGTMHHLYFSGTPAIHMALGAFFSAAEVIPLTFLTVEAWTFLHTGRTPGGARRRDASSRTAGPSCTWPRSASGISWGRACSASSSTCRSSATTRSAPS